MAIVGLDLSHWNAVSDWQKMVDAGVKFVYLKCSEGTYYTDDTFADKYIKAKSHGLEVGAYHFLSSENANAQFEYFKTHMGSRVFDLVPAMDVETRGISQTLVDSLGIKLEAYMLEKPKQFPMPYKHPALYTNQWFANNVFTANAMSRYPLWLATRGITFIGRIMAMFDQMRYKVLGSPPIPKTWKNKGIYIWQDAVTGGGKYGVVGAVDHDLWQTSVPFPGDEPIPPPTPVTKEFTISIDVNSSKYSAKAKLEKK